MRKVREIMNEENYRLILDEANQETLRELCKKINREKHVRFEDEEYKDKKKGKKKKK